MPNWRSDLEVETMTDTKNSDESYGAGALQQRTTVAAASFTCAQASTPPPVPMGCRGEGEEGRHYNNGGEQC
jgi:hypothetical protein